MKKIILAFAMFLFAVTGQAQVGLNFTSSGLTGWTLSPGATIIPSLTNFSDGPYTWNIYPYSGNYMASLQPTSASYSQMTSAFGLNASSLSGIQSFLNTNNGGGATNPTTASYMYYSGLSLSAGTNFSIAWNFVATDYTPYNDTSIVSLVASSGGGLATVNNVLGQYSVLGAINPGAGNYSTNSYGSTGWQLATFSVNTTGIYTLGLGSFNLGDTVLSPILLVSGQTGTTYNGTTPVAPVAPNPGSTAPPPPSSGPTVVSTSTSNTTSTSVSYGNPTNSNTQQNRTVNTNDQQGWQVTYTYIDTVTTTTTPRYTTTTTTPVTTKTWSDGSTTTENGTPTSSTVTDYITTSSIAYASTPSSTAPWLCCGASAAPFNASPTRIAMIEQFTFRTTNDSRVLIDQIGNSNQITVNQTGTKQNYVYYSSNGSSNTATINQSGNGSTQANYISATVNGNYNTVDLNQNSTGGAKAVFATVTDNNNSLTTSQTGAGNHYLDVSLTGGNKTVNVAQNGSGNHMASIALSGNPTSLTLQQNGSIQQSYSIQFNCATSGGCAPIAVKQGN